MELSFPKLNHFWMDSGLLGLTKLLERVQCNVGQKADDDGLTLQGTEKEIKEDLERAYDLLIKEYYNLSTKKQRDNTTAYNFYYDSGKDRFVPFAKKKSVGIAELIYNKAPRPTGTDVKWEKKEKREIIVSGKPVKKNRGILPRSHAHLQHRLDNFLDENNLDVTTAGLLVDGENAVRPKFEIPKSMIPVEGKNVIRGRCFICGEDSSTLDDSSQTVFPFITGGSGVLNFFSHCSKPEKVCWKCSFLGKFVPVNGFYMSMGEDLFSFFPYSSSFEKMLEVYAPLQNAKYEDENLFKNFRHPLGFEKYEDAYFQKPYEVSFAFFYTVYKKVLMEKEEPDSNAEPNSIDWEKMCGFSLSKAPLEFVVVHVQSKGQTTMGKLIWPFTDSVYFFRLMDLLQSEMKVNIKEVMRLLIDHSMKNESKTLIRNKICERILKKRPVIDLIESHVFGTDSTYINPLYEFAVHYGKAIRKEDSGMTSEEQDAAVSLGRRIGMVVGKEGKKGDLFSLRKARRKSDFLNEINRLQFKYSLTVPPDVYEGKLTDLNFVEFKQFCMVAALNSFNAAKQPAKGGEKDEKR